MLTIGAHRAPASDARYASADLSADDHLLIWWSSVKHLSSFPALRSRVWLPSQAGFDKGPSAVVSAGPLHLVGSLCQRLCAKLEDLAISIVDLMLCCFRHTSLIVQYALCALCESKALDPMAVLPSLVFLSSTMKKRPKLGALRHLQFRCRAVVRGT